MSAKTCGRRYKRSTLNELVKGHTRQFPDEKVMRIMLVAYTTVAKVFGRGYMASRYTFSPPDRGIIVPSSSQTKRPQNESTSPRTQSISEAPTDPTDPRMEEGVENMPVPMIVPTLSVVVRQEKSIGWKEVIHEHRAVKDT